MRIFAPRLTTERLFLEEITEKDTDIIIAWRSDPDVYKFFRSPHSLGYKEHLEWFQHQYIENNNRFDWIAFEAKTKKPVGIFGIKREEINAEEAEVSYLLAPAFQGKGYASELVKCIMKFALEKWSCTFCKAEIHIDNYNSIKLVKKLGFIMTNKHGSFLEYKRVL